MRVLHSPIACCWVPVHAIPEGFLPPPYNKVTFYFFNSFFEIFLKYFFYWKNIAFPPLPYNKSIKIFFNSFFEKNLKNIFSTEKLFIYYIATAVPSATKSSNHAATSHFLAALFSGEYLNFSAILSYRKVANSEFIHYPCGSWRFFGTYDILAYTK